MLASPSGTIERNLTFQACAGIVVGRTPKHIKRDRMGYFQKDTKAEQVAPLDLNMNRNARFSQVAQVSQRGRPSFEVRTDILALDTEYETE